MPPLSSSERRALLEIARHAIVESVVHQRIPDLPAQQGPLSQVGSAFVTVHSAGKLRGCVGRIDRTLPLYELVAQCAIGAVTRDARFQPLLAGELEEMDVEISVLSDFRPIAVDAIVPGLHGLFIVRGARRGLLLPQVAAERNWSAERFLAETCGKAGLRPEVWREEGTQVFGFTADVFSESQSPVSNPGAAAD